MSEATPRTKPGFIESGRNAEELAEAYDVPLHLAQPLVSYAIHRREVGGFLTACLENKFVDAACRAHPAVVGMLQGIAKLIFNELPGHSWGSPEIVQAWIAQSVDGDRAASLQAVLRQAEDELDTAKRLHARIAHLVTNLPPKEPEGKSS